MSRIVLSIYIIFASLSLSLPLLLPLPSLFKYSYLLVNPINIIMHMHSSHHSITLNAPKNNLTFFLCVARDSNVDNYVLMWSPRQYVFFRFIINLCYILHMFFYFSYLTGSFHCCLNKIIVIITVMLKCNNMQIYKYNGDNPNTYYTPNAMNMC